MSQVRRGRWTADIEGDFVVFIIGARANKPWQLLRIFRDLGGRRGMNHMLKYLIDHPEKGLLGFERMGIVTVQYWRSFAHLEAFARNADDPHLSAWRTYWKRVGRDDRSGIWHETFLVRDGEYEAVYGNMPPKGLGRATELVPISKASTARNRLRSTATTS